VDDCSARKRGLTQLLRFRSAGQVFGKRRLQLDIKSVFLIPHSSNPARKTLQRIAALFQRKGERQPAGASLAQVTSA
jgi:hypothetical protein